MFKIDSSPYTPEDIVRSLQVVGIKEEDHLFIHSNIGFFGSCSVSSTPEDYYRIFKEAIFKVIGHSGTLVVPTFSYSFCKNEIFDPFLTPSVCGFFSEAVRKDSASLRSEDANFSVAAIGSKAKEFIEDVPPYSFGQHSFWERFYHAKGKFCNFNFDSGSTFFHYAERCLGVSYRYDKAFQGIIIKDGKRVQKTFYHFVYDLKKPEDMPDFVKFDKKAKALGLTKTSNLGRGQIVSISAEDTFNLIEKALKENTRFLVMGDSKVKEDESKKE